MAEKRKDPETYGDAVSAPVEEMLAGFMERAGVRPTDNKTMFALKMQARIAWVEARHKRLEHLYGGPQGYEAFLKFLEANPGMPIKDAVAVWTERR